MSDIYLKDDLERFYGERDIDKITELYLSSKLENNFRNTEDIDLEETTYGVSA